jgi:hypothetical protein
MAMIAIRSSAARSVVMTIGRGPAVEEGDGDATTVGD